MTVSCCDEATPLHTPTHHNVILANLDNTKQNYTNAPKQNYNHMYTLHVSFINTRGLYVARQGTLKAYYLCIYFDGYNTRHMPTTNSLSRGPTLKVGSGQLILRFYNQNLHTSILWFINLLQPRIGIADYTVRALRAKLSRLYLKGRILRD